MCNWQGAFIGDYKVILLATVKKFLWAIRNEPLNTKKQSLYVTTTKKDCKDGYREDFKEDL